VATNAASSVTISGAVLNGTVGPNELATTAVFEWGTDPTLATFTSTSLQTLGAGTTSLAVTAPLSGLNPLTTYYFRVAATNSAGTTKGLIVSFSTVAQPPTVTTAAATNITIDNAVLNGSVNPNGLAVTDAHFEWGTDSALTTFTSTSLQTLAAGFAGQPITASLSGLIPGTTYYFRVTAINSEGTSKGTIVSFITATQPPTVATAAADNITIDNALLNGSVNPNGLATTAVFEWGTDPTLSTLTSTPSQPLGAGTSSVAVTAPLSGLIPGTTYYFRVAATNSVGTSRGLILRTLRVSWRRIIHEKTARG
jgi:phosphodiesterase/alkaline phosphatase D-like protein